MLPTTCENDSCNLTIDPSFGNPGDAYEVNVNACTSDSINCESLAFKINFIEATFDAQATTELHDVADPMSWNVEISKITSITHDLFPNDNTVTNYTLTEDA
jgi:hypothetical protein